MKTYHYELGHQAGQTMTVAELRAKLAEYPDDLPVFATWEGVLAYVQPECFALEQNVHKGKPEEAETALVIDVEQY